jgi:hypothetical protein
MKYASGKYAWGMCGRCGLRARYAELVADGHIYGLRVHPGCRDIKHPIEKPFSEEDGVALRYPSPDLDDDSPGEGDLLEETFDAEVRYFGGGT